MKAMKSIKEIEAEHRNFFAPENVKNKDRQDIDFGDTITVIGVTVSVYQQRNKQNEPLFYENGEPVFGATAYLELDNGKFTTVNGKAAVEQICSLYGTDEAVERQKCGYYPLKDMEPITLRCVKVLQKYGSESYPKIAFEVVE